MWYTLLFPFLLCSIWFLKNICLDRRAKLTSWLLIGGVWPAVLKTLCKKNKIKKIKTLCVSAQLCLTLCDPMDCSPAGSFVHGIFQAGILEWVPFHPPGDLLHPGLELESLVSPALAGRSFNISAKPGRPYKKHCFNPILYFTNKKSTLTNLNDLPKNWIQIWIEFSHLLWELQTLECRNLIISLHDFS